MTWAAWDLVAFTECYDQPSTLLHVKLPPFSAIAMKLDRRLKPKGGGGVGLSFSYQRPSRLTDMRPIAHSNGRDGSWSGDEAVPGFAGRLDDLVIGLEDAV